MCACVMHKAFKSRFVTKYHSRIDISIHKDIRIILIIRKYETA